MGLMHIFARGVRSDTYLLFNVVLWQRLNVGIGQRHRNLLSKIMRNPCVPKKCEACVPTVNRSINCLHSSGGANVETARILLCFERLAKASFAMKFHGVRTGSSERREVEGCSVWRGVLLFGPRQ